MAGAASSMQFKATKSNYVSVGIGLASMVFLSSSIHWEWWGLITKSWRFWLSFLITVPVAICTACLVPREKRPFLNSLLDHLGAALLVCVMLVLLLGA
jgi:hypothetical protein